MFTFFSTSSAVYIVLKRNGTMGGTFHSPSHKPPQRKCKNCIHFHSCIMLIQHAPHCWCIHCLEEKIQLDYRSEDFDVAAARTCNLFFDDWLAVFFSTYFLKYSLFFLWQSLQFSLPTIRQRSDEIILR